MEILLLLQNVQIYIRYQTNTVFIAEILFFKFCISIYVMEY